MSLERFRLQPDDRLAFFQGFLKRPGEVGSVIPSSRFLERRVTQLAGVGRAKHVVELGPGTGGTTRAILRALPEGGRLLSIEINPRFVRHISEISDARLVAHQGSAEELRAALDAADFGAPEAVISGIPFSTMGDELGGRILTAVRDALAPGGCFVAYQLRGTVGVLGRRVFGPAEVDFELRNIPPMRLFRWRKPESRAA